MENVGSDASEADSMEIKLFNAEGCMGGQEVVE